MTSQCTNTKFSTELGWDENFVSLSFCSFHRRSLMKMTSGFVAATQLKPIVQCISTAWNNLLNLNFFHQYTGCSVTARKRGLPSFPRESDNYKNKLNHELHYALVGHISSRNF